ncbi:hypothetical protein N7486_010049 [Penicillium sp. IBT 16267x]|nr:hypothetical protein N7486_010049 [Penicillium sp. IBT 16267x]
MSSTRPSVLFLALGVYIQYEEMYEELINKLKEKAHSFQQVNIAGLALVDLQAGYNVVFVNCEAMTWPFYVPVWNAVVEFVHNGGTAICLGNFSHANEHLAECAPPRNPFTQAGLLWKFDERHRAIVYLNKEYIPLSERRLEALPESYNSHAVFLRNVDITEAWYRPTEIDITNLEIVEAGHVNPFSFSVAMTKVGRGKLGYVGEIGTGTPVEVIMAMAGFSD